MYVATSIEISHRENNFSYAAFSGCHSAVVIKEPLITTADGKATACRVKMGGLLLFFNRSSQLICFFSRGFCSRGVFFSFLS